MSTLYKSLKRQIKTAHSLDQLDALEDRIERGRLSRSLSSAQEGKLESLLSKRESELENGNRSDDYDGLSSSDEYSD
jgi:hypothetical protein